MLPTVRLQRPDSERRRHARRKFSDFPVRTKEAIICEAVTLSPAGQLPYEFELHEYEGVQFIFRSEAPLDVLLAKMSDYQAWVSCNSHPTASLLIYTEALQTVAHAIEFVAPEDESYVAVLLNENSREVDVAVEIRLSPPATQNSNEF